MLFECQRARALLYNKDGASDDRSGSGSGYETENQGTHLLQLPAYPNYGQESKKEAFSAFSKLVQYKASSALDRKLILGVLESDNEEKEVKP